MVYAQQQDCPTTCYNSNNRCVGGCLFCADSGITPGVIPRLYNVSLTPDMYISLSTTATDGCKTLRTSAGAYIYPSGTLLYISGLMACNSAADGYSQFIRVSSACTPTPPTCGIISVEPQAPSPLPPPFPPPPPPSPLHLGRA